VPAGTRPAPPPGCAAGRFAAAVPAAYEARRIAVAECTLPLRRDAMRRYGGMPCASQREERRHAQGAYALRDYTLRVPCSTPALGAVRQPRWSVQAMLSEREAFRQIDLQRQSDELAAKRRAEEAPPATHPAGQSRVRTYAAAHPSSHNDARTPHAQIRAFVRGPQLRSVRVRRRRRRRRGRRTKRASPPRRRRRRRRRRADCGRRERVPRSWLPAGTACPVCRQSADSCHCTRAEQCVEGCCGGRGRF
jgi:hypothetical protein